MKTKTFTIQSIDFSDREGKKAQRFIAAQRDRGRLVNIRVNVTNQIVPVSEVIVLYREDPHANHQILDDGHCVCEAKEGKTTSSIA